MFSKGSDARGRSISAKSKRKSDTKRYHSLRKTSYAARVALQRCPILHMSKSKFMIPILLPHVNRLSAQQNSYFGRFIFPPAAAHFPLTGGLRSFLECYIQFILVSDRFCRKQDNNHASPNKTVFASSVTMNRTTDEVLKKKTDRYG